MSVVLNACSYHTHFKSQVDFFLILDFPGLFLFHSAFYPTFSSLSSFFFLHWLFIQHIFIEHIP